MAEPKMTDLWRTAPIPAVRVWREANGFRVDANAAARAFGLRAGLTEAAWQALARQQLSHTHDKDEDLLIGPSSMPVGCRRVSLGDGCLLWISPDQTPLSRMVPHAEQIDLMTRHGRMGLVVRNLETGEGQWDPHVFRMFGMDPSGGTPDFERAIEAIHPDDLGPFLQAHSVRSLTPGTHSIRFRITRPGGELRYLNSLYSIREDLTGSARLLISLLVDETDSVLHDRAQRETRTALSAAVQLAGISVWHSDPQLGTIEFNESGLRMLGFAGHRGPLSLQEVRSLIHPDDLEAVVRASDEAWSHDQVVDVMARYRMPDGGWRHLLTRRFAVHDESGLVTGLNGISLDVTELTQAREQSMALLDRLRLATDAIGVGFWWRDLDQGSQEWDDRMFRLHCRNPAAGPPSSDEFLTRHVHPDDQPMMRARQARHLADCPAASELTFRILTPEGKTRWIQCWTRRLWREGRRLSFGLHVDVTDRRESELRAEKERERDRYAIQAARVGVWEWPFDGRAAYWSAANYVLHGFEPNDPRPIDELLALACTEASWMQAQALRQACSEGRADYRLEFEVTTAGGLERWLLATGQLLRDEAGRPTCITGVTVDVTERHVAERLARERDRAEQANAAKSELMARVSHELRTPMNAVLGFAELMGLDSLTTSQQDRLARIRSAGTHLLGLIDDLLDLTRSDVQGRLLDLEPVALADLLHEASQWVDPMARNAGVELIWPEQSGGQVVMAERRRLGQVVTNLLTNAIKYNWRGGRVWVTVEAGELAGRPAWAVTVRDSGRGMSPEQLARLFEPFNRLGMEREGIQGSGLGLAIVRRLVEEMGGTLRVGSQAGQGSEFSVTLAGAMTEGGPCHSSPMPERGVVSMPAASGDAGAIKVLYVEDNPVNEMLVSQILAHNTGYELRTAPDGRMGIAEALAWRPQLVLLDLQLPDISGLDVLATLRSVPALVGTRFVALSANAMPADIQDALHQGFDAYWTKPLDVAQFLSDMDTMAGALRAARLSA